MTLHIVTGKCFLACEKVTYIKIEEQEISKQEDDDDLPKKVKKAKRGRPKKEVAALKKDEPKKNYSIIIGYYPVYPSGYTHSREPSEYTLEVHVSELQTAYTLYTEIVREVQEQHPSELYLDQLVRKILSDDEVKAETI